MEKIEKITEMQFYEAIKQAMETGETEIDPAEIVAFCQKKQDALVAKKEKDKIRNAAKKAENDALRDQVFGILTGEYQTIADLVGALVEENPDVTPGKISSRMTQLITDGVAEKAQVTVEDAEGKKSKRMGYRLTEGGQAG